MRISAGHWIKFSGRALPTQLHGQPMIYSNVAVLLLLSTIKTFYDSIIFLLAAFVISTLSIAETSVKCR